MRKCRGCKAEISPEENHACPTVPMMRGRKVLLTHQTDRKKNGVFQILPIVKKIQKKLLQDEMYGSYFPPVNKSAGMKFDDGKLDYSLVDDAVEAEMVAVLTYGAVKYEPGNWRHVEDADNRYHSAHRRHVRARRGGEALDPETRLHHLAHALCDIHFQLGIELSTPAGKELVKTLPERLKFALEQARKIRARRLAQSST